MNEVFSNPKYLEWMRVNPYPREAIFCYDASRPMAEQIEALKIANSADANWQSARKALIAHLATRGASTKDRMELQSLEFKAVNELAETWRVLRQVAVVDDDYPYWRSRYEVALRNFCKAVRENRRGDQTLGFKD